MKRFTDLSVQALKPDPAKRREVPDPGQPGLYVVIQPSGVKSWCVRYRQNDRPRKLTLGRFPALGLAEARKMTAKALERIERGADPATEKAATRRETGAAGHRRSDTVAALVADYMKRRANGLRSAGEIQRTFDRDVLPVIGARPVASVTRRELIELLDSIVDRPAPVLANRTYAALRTMFTWAVGRDWIDASPMTGVPKPAKERARDRVLSPDEIRWFWTATAAMAFPFGDLFRVCLLTGQRVGEVIGMSRDELDGATWIIPGERAKNGEEHTVPLTEPVLDIIRSAPVIDGGELVFTTNGVTPVSGRSKAKARLDRLMAEAAEKEAGEPVEIDRFTIHDLRRTAASGMAELRIAPHVCEAVLNHRSGTVSGVARVYNRHDYADEKCEALEAWANRLASIVDGRAADNVIELGAR